MALLLVGSFVTSVLASEETLFSPPSMGGQSYASGSTASYGNQYNTQPYGNQYNQQYGGGYNPYGGGYHPYGGSSWGYGYNSGNRYGSSKNQGYGKDEDGRKELEFDAKVRLYPYPGSTLSDIDGDVWLHFNKDHGVTFWYDLHGVDVKCAPPTESKANSCGIHLHEYTGDSDNPCDDEDGIEGHYWNPQAGGLSGYADPWALKASYQSIPDSDAKDDKGKAKGFLTIYHGYSEKDTMKTAVVVIHDAEGERQACGVLRPFKKSSSAYGNSYDDAYSQSSYGDRSKNRRNSYNYGEYQGNSWNSGYGSGNGYTNNGFSSWGQYGNSGIYGMGSPTYFQQGNYGMGNGYFNQQGNYGQGDSTNQYSQTSAGLGLALGR